MYELKDLEGWCTVVVADKKTPVGPWDAVKPRVKLLTVEEQGALGYHILPHLPWNHFGRKNLGFLYAIRRGARVIYDTDDDNILKRWRGKAFIPYIPHRSDAANMIAQAWHCSKFPNSVNSPGRSSVWNPYVPFGARTSWPRGMPLDDIIPSQTGCGEGEGGNQGSSNTVDVSPYNLLYHPTPGIRFAVQQSLADVHPDIDGIHRLTRSPLTFGFLNTTRFHGLYAPDGVYAPYNAQATIHEYQAFWSLLLPITVHGRVSDIWRSYIAQRLMWRYGLRVAFMRPFVDQDRTPHNYLKDFQAEVPLYLRAGGLVDFLSSWSPSSPDLPLPAEYEELLIALYENGVVEEADVLVTQAWLLDLMDSGYAFPTLNDALYEAWKAGGQTVEGGDGTLGTAVGVVSQEGDLGGKETALALAHSWANMKPPPRSSKGSDLKVSAVLFHVEGEWGGEKGVHARDTRVKPSTWDHYLELGENRKKNNDKFSTHYWWTDEIASLVRAAAPDIVWEFHPILISPTMPDFHGSLPPISGLWGAQDFSAFSASFHAYGIHLHPAVLRRKAVWFLPPHTHSTKVHEQLGWESTIFTGFISLKDKGKTVAEGEQRDVLRLGEEKIESSGAFQSFCKSLDNARNILHAGGLSWSDSPSFLCTSHVDLVGEPGGVIIDERVFNGARYTNPTYFSFLNALGWREGLAKEGWEWSWMLTAWLEGANVAGISEQ